MSYILLRSLHTPPLVKYSCARYILLRSLGGCDWLSVGGRSAHASVLPEGVRPRPIAPSVSVLHTPPLATYSCARYILLRSLHTPPFARRLRLAFRRRSVRPCFGASRRRASASHGAKCKCLTHSSARYILLRSLQSPPLVTYSSVRSAAPTSFPLAVGPPMLRSFQEACVRVPRRQV